jgi:hypothetical protein
MLPRWIWRGPRSASQCGAGRSVGGAGRRERARDLEGNQSRVGRRAEGTVGGETAAVPVEQALQRRHVRAAIAEAEQVRHFRPGATELARRVPGADEGVAAFEMHGILGSEAGTPVPAMPVEDRGDRRQALLHAAVAAGIRDAVERQVDRRAPRMVADRRGRPAHKAHAQHAGRAQGRVDIALLHRDLVGDLCQRTERWAQAACPERSEVAHFDERRQGGIGDVPALLIVRAARIAEQAQHGGLPGCLDVGIDARRHRNGIGHRHVALLDRRSGECCDGRRRLPVIGRGAPSCVCAGQRMRCCCYCETTWDSGNVGVTLRLRGALYE